MPRIVLAALLLCVALPARAALDAATLQTRLEALNAEGAALLVKIRQVRLATPAQLAELQSGSTAYAGAVTVLADQIAAETDALPVTPGVLAALATLSARQSALSRETSRAGPGIALIAYTPLSGPTLINSGTANANLLAAYATLLRLSDDIGLMADRIGEMADRILIMADKIGEMADRILITQQIQSANYALTVDAILKTQDTMLAALQLLKPCR